VAAGRLPFFPRATGVFFRCLSALFAPVTVEGRENIPREGPVLVIVNHASNADGPVLMAYFIPVLGRRLTWLGKEEALRWPFVGWAMRQNGVVAVKRGAGDLEAFRTAKQALDEGRPLAIFPEGTRSRDGALQEAKEGAAVLALRSGAPILPVAIAGSQRFWPRGKLLPRPRRRILLRIGEAFQLTLLGGGDRRQATHAATTELMRHIAELLPAEQRGAYAEPERGPGGPVR
jgi:1-acyl-sn-glycerol-3-phosphate acyltransferase